MKRILSLVMFTLVFASICLSGTAQAENEATPFATPEPAKSFNSYTLASYSFSIPDYYYERESTADSLTFESAITDADAAIMIGVITQLDESLEDYVSKSGMISENLVEFFNFDNSKTLSDEFTSASGFIGRMLKGNGSADGYPLSFIFAHFFDPNNKNLITVFFMQKDASSFDYSADAIKVIESITVGQPSEAACQPTTKPTKQPTANPTKQPTAKPTVKPTVANKRPTISYESFFEVQMGMTVDEVKKILGDNGELFTSTDFLNVKTEIYSWTGSGFSMILVTFSNGTVIEKTQSGLNQVTATATTTKFSQIFSGMTYEQVKAIMGGDGCMISESSMMGIETVVYQWNGNSLYSMATITFQNGKVSSTSQQGLS